MMIKRPGELGALFQQSGWRRIAIVNTVLESVVAIVLVTSVIQTASASGSVDTSHSIFKGNCEKSGKINLMLHLLINIGSTCIIASSNWFMQILSSPTRQEVDKAHQQSLFLEIGVPSFRNIGHISRRKSVLWTLFLLTSLPIHLLFNSSVFETDYQGSEFFMGIVTEDFVAGGSFHGPGASLITPGGFSRPDVLEYLMLPFYDEYNLGLWGKQVNRTDFLDQSSPAMRNLSFASQSAKQWDRLDAHDCRALYGTCSPRRDYASVLLVASGQLKGLDADIAQAADTTGFVSDHLFNWTDNAVPVRALNFSADERREYWNDLGPLDEPNPLWFSAWCRMKWAWDPFGREELSWCDHTCVAALGIGNDSVIDGDGLRGAVEQTTTVWDIPLKWYNAAPEGLSPDQVFDSSNQTIKIGVEGDWSNAYIDERPMFNSTHVNDETALEVTHCYAEPLNVCNVAVSNTILLVVALCVVVKVILSIITCTAVPGDPLATPGDALVSFIRRPDPFTERRAGISLAPGVKKAPWRRHGNPRGTEWRETKLRRIAAAIPVGSWVRTYVLIVPGLIAASALYAMAKHDTPLNKDTGAFVHNQDVAIIETVEWIVALPFLGKVVLVNTAQLVLSFCYFAYNALITRACTEIEWNSYSTSYKPLRVSHPEEGQAQTYRLQLPYRYSIPLILMSILLHWLVSNTIYVGITEGEYKADLYFSIEPLNLSGLTESAYVVVGYSTVATLVALLLCIAIAVIPVIFMFRLKSNMVVCGNSSFTLSAACHVSTWNINGWPLRSDGSMEMQPLISRVTSSMSDLIKSPKHKKIEEASLISPENRSESGFDEEGKKARILHEISTSKVRWGVVRMPPEWYDSFQEAGHEVEHLTFGTVDQDVQHPRRGGFYA